MTTEHANALKVEFPNGQLQGNANDAIITQCEEGYHRKSNGSKCVSCTENQYWDDDQCHTVETTIDGCSNYKGEGVCAECSEGKTLSVDQRVCFDCVTSGDSKKFLEYTTTCPEINTNNEVENCGSYEKYSENPTCTECNASTLLLVDQQCVTCDGAGTTHYWKSNSSDTNKCTAVTSIDFCNKY